MPTTTNPAGADRPGHGGVAALSPQHQELLARRLAQLGLAPTAAPAVPRVPRTGGEQSFACSSGQQRMWLASQFDPADPSFHVAMSQRLTGALDVGALRVALADLVARHEILRTGYVGVDGEPRQVLRPTGEVPVTEVDLRHLPAADREDRARDLAREAFAVPFDLAAGPVLRASLFRLADDEHVLLATSHHIAIDGWSIGNALRELAALYAWRLAGGSGAPPLPDLPVQYADYAEWQHRGIADGALEPGLAYWRSHLAAPRADAHLPIARRHTGPARAGGAKRHLRIGPDLVEGLRAAAGGSRGTTPFVTLLTAFTALLARYTGQHDVTVGTLVAARTHVELEPLIGYFANPIALRTDVGPDLTFAEAAGRVRRTVIDGFAHQNVPFDLVVQEVAPRRDADRHPIFQSAVILHNFTEGGPSAWPGLSVSWWDSQLDDMLFDLTLVGVPQADGGLELTFSYRTEVFDDADIGRFAGHFRQLLTAVVAAPGQRLGDVALLTPDERHRALVDWQGPTGTPPAGSFPELFARACAATPDAIAVSDDTDRLTYRELAARADRLAVLLRERGVRPETPVGICLDRSVSMLVAVLGVWRAGGAYVPLDPAFPADRLRLMVDDAGVTVLVTQRSVRDRLPQLCAGPGVVCLDDERQRLRTPAPAADDPGTPPPVRPPHAGQLAYVIYTSGSTGRPKGVEVTHGAVANLLLSFRRSLGLTDADRLLAVTTLSFDISVLELLLPLICGARVLVATAAEVADGTALRGRAEADRATVLQATPATWRLLLSAGGVPAGIRHRLCGGEAFSRDLVRELAGGRLWNVYGPTETTVWSAAGVVDPGDGPVAIGPPIDNTRILLLDGRGQPVPVGVAGEVHIGGLGLARGYHRRPALTAQRFVPDPFGDTPGGRLYATGDLARYLPDGRLEFLGRGDQQVKVRGFRVELGEIEEALRAEERVRDAAVTAWHGAGDGDARLVAYVVGTESGTDPAGLWAAIRPGLARRLPGYMVPATLVVLDALPLTPNGKVNRQALPAPDWGATDATAYVAPRDPVEEAIVGIWEEVLDVRPIGVDADFFALGGHSLLAERVLARIRAYFQLEAPTRALFDAPTVAGLAAALTGLEPVPGQVAAVAELRAQIASMSPEAVETMLAQEGAR
ncbi:amino acid adenylation domain-containing protein [Micromonospora echinospora]|uniref:amino acid adenylation domain-containing protein n=1 Tax=Micromonospora echinospora TaxID=1877 RepID=UPI003673040F